MLVGAFRRLERAGLVVDVEMALRRAVDAIGPVQTRVEPLRRVGHAHLLAQHEAGLVVIGAGVLLAVEISALPAPIGPGAGEAMEHLLGALLGVAALVLGQRCEGRRVGLVPPQPRRHVRLDHRAQTGRHAGLAEIFLGEDVARHLAPLRRHLDVGLMEHARAVGIADLAGGGSKRDAVIGILTRHGEPTLDPHCPAPINDFPPCRHPNAISWGWRQPGRKVLYRSGVPCKSIFVKNFGKFNCPQTCAGGAAHRPGTVN